MLIICKIIKWNGRYILSTIKVKPGLINWFKEKTYIYKYYGYTLQLDQK